MLGYPRLFELTASCPESGLDLYKRGLVDRAGDLLDQVILTRATAAGATFKDVRPRFSVAITAVAVVPPVKGLAITPLQVEGVLMALLVFLGAQTAWTVGMAATEPQTAPPMDAPARSRW